MKSILSAAGGAALSPFAAGRVLLAFDYDGTLAPLRADPTAARLPPSTKRRLAELARLSPLAIVSGRSLAALGPLLAGVRPLACVGNHGLEWEANRLGGSAETRARLERRVARWGQGLVGIRSSGARIEEKGLSISVHLRGLRREARERIHRLLRALPGATIVPGKETLNVVPEGAPGKGAAIRRLARSVRAEAVFFAGDDLTDEAVFDRPGTGAFVGVHVGPGPSRAEYRLHSQREMDSLLDLLLALRRDSPRPSRYPKRR